MQNNPTVFGKKDEEINKTTQMSTGGSRKVAFQNGAILITLTNNSISGIDNQSYKDLNNESKIPATSNIGVSSNQTSHYNIMSEGKLNEKLFHDDYIDSKKKNNDIASNSNTPNTGSNFSIESGSNKNIASNRMKLSTNSRAYNKDKGRVSNDFMLFHEDLDQLDVKNNNEESEVEDNSHMEGYVNDVLDHPESPQHKETKYHYNEPYKKLEKEDEDSVSSSSEKGDCIDEGAIPFHQQDKYN